MHERERSPGPSLQDDEPDGPGAFSAPHGVRCVTPTVSEGPEFAWSRMSSRLDAAGEQLDGLGKALAQLMLRRADIGKPLPTLAEIAPNDRATLVPPSDPEASAKTDEPVIASRHDPSSSWSILDQPSWTGMGGGARGDSDAAGSTDGRVARPDGTISIEKPCAGGGWSPLPLTPLKMGTEAELRGERRSRTIPLSRPSTAARRPGRASARQGRATRCRTDRRIEPTGGAGRLARGVGGTPSGIRPRWPGRTLRDPDRPGRGKEHRDGWGVRC